MAIHLDRLQTKLGAMESKDLDEIMARDPLSFIPGLGLAYTKTELQAWLQKRIDYLEACKLKTELQIDSTKDTLYSGMTKTEQDIVDKILADELYTLDLKEVDFDKICEVVLYKFIVEKEEEE